MQPLASSRLLWHYTHLPLEIFVLCLTVLPILVLVHFYQMLPDRVPEYLNLRGEVEVWGQRSFASVFRLPLMALDLQVLCLLTKYGSLQAKPRSEDSQLLSDYEAGSLQASSRLLDWFRAFIAIKLGVSSLETIFFSIPRFHFLTSMTRVTSWGASILGIAGACFYGYKLLSLSRKLEQVSSEQGIQRNRSRARSRVFYFNPRDAAWFSDRYMPNFGNKWIYLFMLCLVFLPLLMFWPLLS
jgi:uncharacterized membrane protein